MKRGAALAVFFLSSRAFALDPPFGARGQIVITQNAAANVTWTGFDSSRYSTFSANLDPSIDWFAFRNVSFGADAHVGYRDVRASDNAQSNDQTSSAYVGLRVAGNLPFSRWVSLWPRATVYFKWSQETVQLYTVDPGTVTTTIGAQLTLFVPLLFHLRSHYFIGFGPLISHTFGDSESTRVAFTSILGGTIGGERSAHDDDVPVAWKPFGEEHETIIEGGADFTYVTAPSGPTTWSMRLDATVAHFVAEHLSLGASVGASYSHATTSISTSEDWQVYVSPAVAYDVPISTRFSFYPSAGLGFAATTSNQRTATGETSGTILEIYVGAYAPVVYQAAPHFILGFGPTVTRDLAVKDPRSTAETHPATRVGAAFSLGGWL